MAIPDNLAGMAGNLADALHLSALRFNAGCRDGARSDGEGIVGGGDEVDWGALVSMAVRHRTASLVYGNLKQLGWWEQLPAVWQGVLRETYLRVTGENMRLRHKLVEVVEVLEAEQVEVVPFKGPLLSGMLYGERLVRPSQDLDLLIPGQSLGRAWDALAAAGYRPREGFWSKSRFERFSRFGKEFDLVDAGGRVAIDLHWRLTGNIRERFDYAFCRERLQRVAFAGREFSCLSDEDMVVYLCLHGANDLWVSMGAVLWLAEYIQGRPGLDWGRVMALAGRLRCRRVLLVGLFLAGDMFEVALPEVVTGCFTKDRAVAGLVERVYAGFFGGLAAEEGEGVGSRGGVVKDESGKGNRREGEGGKAGKEGGGSAEVRRIQQRLPRVSFLFRMREGVQDKVGYLLWMAFWPSKREWELLPLPAGLAFLHFVFRPLRLGWYGVVTV